SVVSKKPNMMLLWLCRRSMLECGPGRRARPPEHGEAATCRRRQVNTLNGEGPDVSQTFRRLALTAALLFLPGPAAAEVNIDPGCRMKNLPPGRCGWCSVETLARHHHIKVLYGLVEDHPTNANPEDLTAVLDKSKVHYQFQKRGDRDTAILRASCADGLGAVVGFRPLYEGGGGHIVTLVDFTDETVKVIDPNDQDGRVRTMTTERFLRWWDGFTLVLQPERPAKK